MAGAILGILANLGSTKLPEPLEWRVSQFVAQLRYSISPPERAVFVPQGAAVSQQSSSPDQQAIPFPTQTVQLPTATPVPSTTVPLPTEVSLSGFKHEYQTWNNCGPATLSMALSFWDWKGTQEPIAAFTKPNSRDKNVMPYELLDYVETETELRGIARVGGNIQLLKQLLASGLAVIIEKGFILPKEGWMGHYELVTAYDDASQRFTLQDSFLGPDQSMTYDELETNWRAFNFTYLVIYPATRQKEVEIILGSSFDETNSYRAAFNRASAEIYELEGRDQFFAWFNRGSTLVKLQDYAGASDAYDQAFALYPKISEKDRPWRTMWYQTGPYWAYYYTGRYQDVIDLATTTLDTMSEPVLEESYYWRALAWLEVGNQKSALKDLRSSLQYHPNFEPAMTQLKQLNQTP